MGKFYIFLFAFFLCLLCEDPIQGRSNLKNIDKPILLDAGPYKSRYVIFNHSSHKDVACRNCHHVGLPSARSAACTSPECHAFIHSEGPIGDRYAACTSLECHAITAASSREPLSVYMAYHAPNMKRSCFGCHKPLAGKYAGFKGCGPCHGSLRIQREEEDKK